MQRLRVMLGLEMKLKKRKKSRMRKFRGIPTAVSAAYVNFQSCQMYEDFFRFYIYDLEADSLCFLTTFSRPLPLPSPCPNGISCYSCYVADGRSESVPDSHAPTLPDNYGAARRAGGVGCAQHMDLPIWTGIDKAHNICLQNPFHTSKSGILIVA